MQLSLGSPLKRLFLSLMVDHDLIAVLRLDVRRLTHLLTNVEDAYNRSVPCAACGQVAARARDTPTPVGRARSRTPWP